MSKVILTEQVKNTNSSKLMSASQVTFDTSISDFPSDINTVQEALDYLSSLNLLIGTKITILASGSWVCPATGQWGLELHGGGGLSWQ